MNCLCDTFKIRRARWRTLEDVIDEPIRAEELCIDQINLEDVGRMVLRTIEKVEQSRNKLSK